MEKTRFYFKDGTYVDFDRNEYCKPSCGETKHLEGERLEALKFLCKYVVENGNPCVTKEVIYNNIIRKDPNAHFDEHKGAAETLCARIRKIISDKNFPYTGSNYIKLLLDDSEFTSKRTEVYDTGLDYFRENTKDVSDIESIDIVTHTGSFFLSQLDYVPIFNNLKRNNVKIRILLNTPDVSDSICQYFSSHDKAYPYGTKTHIQKWLKTQEENPENVEIRITQIPILHSYYCIHNKKCSIAAVSFYSYGVPYEQLHRETYNEEEPNFDLFQKEFKWLWNHKSTISIKDFIVHNNEENTVR